MKTKKYFNCLKFNQFLLSQMLPRYSPVNINLLTKLSTGFVSKSNIYSLFRIVLGRNEVTVHNVF